MSGMDRNSAKALAGNAHLAQSIGDILTTPIGSRVMRRDYGSMLPDLIDHPLNGANQLLIFAASAQALRRWEPRLKATRFTLTIDPDAPGQATLEIEGTRTDLPDPNTRIVLSIPIRTGGASTARTVN